MAPQVKGLAAQAWQLEFNPKTPMVVGEKQLPELPFDLHVCPVMHMPTDTHTVTEE